MSIALLPTGAPTAAATVPSVPPARPARSPRLWLAGWPAAVLAAVASQITYWQTWFYGRSVPYDAELNFWPLFVFGRREFRAGHEIFGLRQEIFGGYPFYSYFYATPLRLLCALFLPPDLNSVDAYLQVFHVLGSVFIFAALLRTFAVPRIQACLGGFLFMAAGIHVSLAQHVLSQEALAYGGLVLLLTRLLCLHHEELSRWRRAALVAGTVVAATALARGVQEAVTFCVPAALWVIGHGWIAHHRLGRGGQRKTLWIELGLIGTLTALCSVPQLLSWLEMGEINRTLVTDYTQTGRYFSDPRVFFAGLVFPEVTGGSWPSKVARARVDTDFTLGYTFAGHLCCAFLLMYAAGLVRAKRWGALGGLAGAIILSLGYAFGGGSPVHFLLTRVFPPLGWLHHYYYGLHVFYGLSAFAAAVSIASFLARPRAADALLATTGAVLTGGLLWMTFQFGGPVRGLTSSPEMYAERLDAQWVEFVLVNLLLLGLLLIYAKLAAGPRRAGAAVALGYALLVLVCADLIRPAFGQLCTPGGTDMHVWSTREALATLGAQDPAPAGAFRAPRLLGIDLLWFSDLPVLVGIDTLKSGDTVGARAIDEAVAGIRAAPDGAEALRLAETIGADYLWVRNPALRARLAEPGFTLLTQAAGALFRVNPALPPAKVAEDGTLQISWWPSPGVVERTRSLFGSDWTFDLRNTPRGGCSRVALPLQALRFFAAFDPASGERLETNRDDAGRLVVGSRARALPERMVIRYPNLVVTALLGSSLVVYLLTSLGAAAGLIAWVVSLVRRQPGIATLPVGMTTTFTCQPRERVEIVKINPDPGPILPGLSPKLHTRRWPWGLWTMGLGLGFLLALDGYHTERDNRQTAILEVSCRLPVGVTDTQPPATLLYRLFFDTFSRATGGGTAPANTDVVGRCDYRFPVLLKGLNNLVLMPASPGTFPTVQRFSFLSPVGGPPLASLNAETGLASPESGVTRQNITLQWPTAGMTGAAQALLPVRLPTAPSAWVWVGGGTLAYGLGFGLAILLIWREVERRGRTAFLECRRVITWTAGRLARTRRWQLGLACGLVLAMASASAYNRHPDEIYHREAARFYETNFLPPAVDDPRVAPSVSRYGFSYLQELDPVYFLTGKFSAIVAPLLSNSDLAPRFFNVLLFTGLALLAAARRRAWEPMGILLLLTPQIWYVFSYVNSDGFSLFLSMLVSWQLGWRDSGLHRFLTGVRGRIIAGVAFGLLLGFLLCAKKNYLIVVLLAAFYAGWSLWFAIGGGARRVLAQRWGMVAIVALAVVAPRVAYDGVIHDFDKPTLATAACEARAQPGFRPSDLRTGRSSASSGLRLKERGTSLGEMLAGGRWAEESWMSFTGFYGWMNLPGPTVYYRAMKYLFFAFTGAFLLALFKLLPRSEMILATGCLALAALTVLLCAGTSWVTDFQPQGRYLFPILPLFGFLALRHPRAWGHPAVVLLSGAIFALGAWSFISVALMRINP